MHTYINQTITFNITDKTFQKLKISKAQEKHLKTVLYSIVFHQIFDFTLTFLTNETHKQYVISSLKSEPSISEMEFFLETNIKNHKYHYKKIAEKAEKDFIVIILNNLISN